METVVLNLFINSALFIAKQYGLDCVTRPCTFHIGALTNTECLNTPREYSLVNYINHVMLSVVDLILV